MKLLRTAHPRSRGENGSAFVIPVIRVGSSPLTRGKPWAATEAEASARLIPAHAGKTPKTWTSCEKRRGSSPLTRGKRIRPMMCAIFPGLIPAHAGKTRSRNVYRRHPPAHPRSRGENRAAAALTSAARGSSPLTRGKPPPSAIHRPDLRLIPAHAGKTNRSTASTPWIPAHPRSRGENYMHSTYPDAKYGSSPLTRGKLKLTAYPRLANRLIPAHAGKT